MPTRDPALPLPLPTTTALSPATRRAGRSPRGRARRRRHPGRARRGRLAHRPHAQHPLASRPRRRQRRGEGRHRRGVVGPAEVRARSPRSTARCAGRRRRARRDPLRGDRDRRPHAGPHQLPRRRRRSPSWATRSSPSAAAACSRGRPPRCGRACSGWPPCRRTTPRLLRPRIHRRQRPLRPRRRRRPGAAAAGRGHLRRARRAASPRCPPPSALEKATNPFLRAPRLAARSASRRARPEAFAARARGQGRLRLRRAPARGSAQGARIRSDEGRPAMPSRADPTVIASTPARHHRRAAAGQEGHLPTRGQERLARPAEPPADHGLDGDERRRRRSSPSEPASTSGASKPTRCWAARLERTLAWNSR